ncbi:AraC family transcriptional regulator [Dyella lipolytica]|uniref:AraC family transcriptional regulator n=1 Tax=Dyella lipolytica TaxID=1867835 RepID=A0ABW8IXH9_9GAMM|nr:AraC family transcriptional regulator [Dyella lipolytica]GLQ45993.1 AraC family transcriptional regulator [Dyella lipolytica]
MDPLSEVLTLLKPRRLKTGAVDVAGKLSIGMPAHDGLFCYAVVRGVCWLALDGLDPRRLSEGDCVLLPSGRPFRIGSDLETEPVDAASFFATRENGAVGIYNGGGECLVYAGHFDFERRDTDLLLSLLPPIVHIREEDDRGTLRWSLDRMMNELREPQCGGDLVVEHLAHLVLLQALRLHLTEARPDQMGWLAALGDKRMSAVITALHAAPAQCWSVRTMACVAGMSRTAFATRFKARVGLSPMEYLTRWRMLLAATAMKQRDQTVSSAAYYVGYTSEAAFSTAFKRVMGCSPRHYNTNLR